MWKTKRCHKQEGEFIERDFNEAASRSRDSGDDFHKEIKEEELNQYIEPGQLQNLDLDEVTMTWTSSKGEIRGCAVASTS